MSALSEATADRHRAVADAARWLEPNPNLPEAAFGIAEHFEGLAATLLDRIATDDPQLTRCLDTLTQAKDYAVRAWFASVNQIDSRPYA
jgi:hypothetical protein